MAAISVLLLVVSPPPFFGHVHTIAVVNFKQTINPISLATEYSPHYDLTGLWLTVAKRVVVSQNLLFHKHNVINGKHVSYHKYTK
jgi:hypothetical protein